MAAHNGKLLVSKVILKALAYTVYTKKTQNMIIIEYRILSHIIVKYHQHRVTKLLKVLSLAHSHQAWRHALSTVYTWHENAKHIQHDLKNEQSFDNNEQERI